MDFPGLPARLAAVHEAVARHQETGGWSHPVRIVAVTKTHGPEAVRAAVAAGVRDVGENRVQEALHKQDALIDFAVDWHLVGTLQRNKAKHAAGRFVLIHSVDRVDLAVELDRRGAPGSRQAILVGTLQRNKAKHAAGRFVLIHSVDRLDLAAEIDRRAAPGRRQAILVQVNCSAEPQKGGVEPAALPDFLDQLRSLRQIRVRGLMTMSALTDDRAEQRRAFRLLRELRDQAERAGHSLPELSMGMSGDYPIAVEEGATMIRLGTILFGERAA